MTRAPTPLCSQHSRRRRSPGSVPFPLFLSLTPFPSALWPPPPPFFSALWPLPSFFSALWPPPPPVLFPSGSVAAPFPSRLCGPCLFYLRVLSFALVLWPPLPSLSASPACAQTLLIASRAATPALWLVGFVL